MGGRGRRQVARPFTEADLASIGFQGDKRNIKWSLRNAETTRIRLLNLLQQCKGVDANSPHKAESSKILEFIFQHYKSIVGVEHLPANKSTVSARSFLSLLLTRMPTMTPSFM